MKRTLLTPRKKDDDEWLRGNIFYSTCNILDKVCKLVIDGGSCENIVSQEAVDKLGSKQKSIPILTNYHGLRKEERSRS